MHSCIVYLDDHSLMSPPLASFSSSAVRQHLAGRRWPGPWRRPVARTYLITASGSSCRIDRAGIGPRNLVRWVWNWGQRRRNCSKFSGFRQISQLLSSPALFHLWSVFRRRGQLSVRNWCNVHCSFLVHPWLVFSGRPSVALWWKCSGGTPSW